MTTTALKMCAACGADLSAQKRVKDPRTGQYYCHPCWDAVVVEAQTNADAQRGAEGETTTDPLFELAMGLARRKAPAPVERFACKFCGGDFDVGQVYDQGGSIICHGCWSSHLAGGADRLEAERVEAAPASPPTDAGGDLMAVDGEAQADVILAPAGGLAGFPAKEPEPTLVVPDYAALRWAAAYCQGCFVLLLVAAAIAGAGGIIISFQAQLNTTVSEDRVTMLDRAPGLTSFLITIALTATLVTVALGFRAAGSAFTGFRDLVRNSWVTAFRRP